MNKSNLAKSIKDAMPFVFEALSGFYIRHTNAKTAIEQIRNGEWKPRYNNISMRHLTARKDGMELWLGNGAWFCEIHKQGEAGYFGLVWRHWVYWAAARKLRIDADNSYKVLKKKVPVLK